MISLEELRAFKTQFSDENLRIGTLLRTEFLEYAEPPILDVGAGLGDISRAAFYDRDVVLLDPLGIEATGVAEGHRTIEADFFDFRVDSAFETLLFSHVLQFLDGDLGRLFERTCELAPSNVLIVQNTNDDFMGELISWASESLKEVNPEVAIEGFPPNFSPTKSVRFTGTVKCDTFEPLTQQVQFLLDCSEAHSDKIRQFLEARLALPTFTINQSITGYLPCRTI